MSGAMPRVLLLLLALPLLAGTADADQDAAWAALRGPAAVALMRHADAPGAAGDPAGFRLDDCATQRNLSTRGRSDAAAVGARLRRQGVVVGRMLSSPWCRCVDTARLLELGAVEVAETFSNAFVLRDRRSALTEGARDIVAAWRGPGVLLVVTHGANILALTGVAPAASEIVVVAADGAERAIRVIGRIPPP